MNHTPTLSICIPTYNRSEYLRETLNNIMEELRGLPLAERNNIDVCISDNQSNDKTKEIVSELITIYPVRITFETNATNLGPDSNFIKAVGLSNSEFVWLLGSDDKVTKGGLHYLYSFIEKHDDIDLIFLNTTTYKKDGITLLQPSSQEYEKIIFYKDALEASVDVIYEAGLISILCFRRSKWEAIVGYDEFLNSWYVHQYKFLSMIKDGAKTCRIYSPRIVAYRAGNESILKSESVLKRMQTLVNSLYNIPGSIFGFNSREHRSISAKNIKLNFPPLYIVFQVSRLNFSQRIEIIKEFYRNFKSFIFFYYRFLPFLLVPIGNDGKFFLIFSVDSVSKKFKKF